jgi:hypothetical protein
MLMVNSAWGQSGSALNEGIWADDWLGGYGGFLLPLLGVVLALGLVVWRARKQKKQARGRPSHSPPGIRR